MAYKVCEFRGNANITHIFFRQVWGFGGEQEQLDADDLQLAEKVDNEPDYTTITAITKIIWIKPPATWNENREATK